MSALVQHDIESESLPAHVSICQERYNQLDLRISNIETKLGNIDAILCEIRDKINQDHKEQFKVVLTAAGAVITTLSAAIGYLLMHYVLR